MFFCEGRDSDQTDFWASYDDGSPKAVAYCVTEAMTVGTWNLLLIAVNPDRQGNGIGAQLMSFVEAKRASEGARVLLVETSGTDDFIRTRALYAQLGYDEEARIREYYDAGDDKIVFRKAL
jgi:ribosomal protein S18 acetylase RimI-like enzyme